VAKRTREFPQDRISPSVDPRDVASVDRSGAGLTGREQQARVRRELDAQVGRIHDIGVRAQAVVGSGPDSSTTIAARAEIAALETRRTRLASSLREARATGDRRRVVSLQLRGRRVMAELEARRSNAGPQLRNTARGPLPAGLVRLAPTSVQRKIVRRAMTRQLDLAARAADGESRQTRSGAASLAGLAGMTPAEYLRRPPAAQRVARLEIERELARRRDLLSEVAPTRRAAVVASLSRRHRSRAPFDVEHAPSQAESRSRQFGTPLR